MPYHIGTSGCNVAEGLSSSALATGPRCSRLVPEAGC